MKQCKREQKTKQTQNTKDVQSNIHFKQKNTKSNYISIIWAA